MKSILILIVILVLFSCQKTTNENSTTNDPPISKFRDSTIIVPPLLVQFSNPTASNFVSFVWNFGDGGNSFLTNPSHSYLSFGNYAVRLVQQNVVGTADTIVKLIDTRENTITLS